MNVQLPRLCLLVLLVGAFSACATTDAKKPALESSATSLSYAAQYPARLQALIQTFQEGRDQTRERLDAFGTYPDAVSKTDWTKITQLVKLSDEAGRSRAVAENRRASRLILSFLEENSGRLASSVNYQVNQAAQKKNCSELEVAGKTRYILNEVTERQIESRYREVHEGHQFIVTHEKSLGKRNRKTLQLQTDEITQASLFVYVDAIEITGAMERYLQEIDQVRDTLGDAIEEQQTLLNDPKTSRGAKKEAQKRIKALQEAREPLDETSQQAQELVKTSEQDLKTLQTDYQKALEQLLQTLQSKS